MSDVHRRTHTRALASSNGNASFMNEIGKSRLSECATRDLTRCIIVNWKIVILIRRCSRYFTSVKITTATTTMKHNSTSSMNSMILYIYDAHTLSLFPLPSPSHSRSLLFHLRKNDGFESFTLVFCSSTTAAAAFFSVDMKKKEQKI